MAKAYLYDLTDTWNAGGTTFTAIKMNATDTASAAASMLIDLQIGGTTQFHVLKSGAVHTKRSNYNITNTNAASILVSNYSLTGSDATSMFDLAGTWNTSGTPTAIKLNMTDTASNASSLLMDLQVGAASKFRVSKAGAVSGSGFQTTASSGAFQIANRFYMDSTADGVVRLLNAAGSAFTRIQLGGDSNGNGAVATDGAGVKFVGGAGGSTAWTKVPGVIVANLPAAATAGAGARSFVTNALAPTFGSAVVGGGAVNVPVYSDGAAWFVG